MDESDDERVALASMTGPYIALRFSDGRRIRLRGLTLVGRHPRAAASEGVVDLVAFDDPERSISKTHLLVGADPRGLYVTDLYSTNGTIVTLPDGQQILCGGGESVRVPIGGTVSFGNASFAHDVHERG